NSKSLQDIFVPVGVEPYAALLMQHAHIMFARVKCPSREIAFHNGLRLLSFRDNDGGQTYWYELLQLGPHVAQPDRVLRAGKRTPLRAGFGCGKNLARTGGCQLRVVRTPIAARAECWSQAARCFRTWIAICGHATISAGEH